jgi:hypothetical protein
MTPVKIAAATTTATLRRAPAVATLLAFVAAVAVLSALLVHSACVDPGPPVARPEPGTARAGYCGVVHGARLWLLLAVAPVLAAAVTAALARGRLRLWVLLVAAAAVGGTVANVILVHSLAFAHTI